MEIQYNIFDYIREDFKLDKEIRLIELFGGYGSQNLALKYLIGKSCHYKLCEWAIKSIQAYNDLHIRDYTNYSINLSDDEVLDKLVELGVSADYNKCALREQLKRMNYRMIYNNIIATNNLVDISKVRAKDLEIVDKEKYDYIVSYSFPCQDLSLAGLVKGMQRNSNTRSGLLWQVERILLECKELNCLPQVLVMENVPNVHGEKNMEDFKSWLASLEKLGYSNYWKDLNTKDYGIPQNRNRCFMVSILGEYKFEFMKPIDLHLRLQDLCEENVDKEYYLTEKQISDIREWKAFEKPLESAKKNTEKGISQALTTRCGHYCASMVLIEGTKCVGGYGNYWGETTKFHVDGKIWKGDIANTILTQTQNKYILPISSRFHQQNRIYKGDIANNITTHANPNYIVKVGNYSPSGYEACDIIDPKGISKTVMENHGLIQSIVLKDLKDNNVGIRKLTPRECFRLQGLIENDIDNIMENQTKPSSYHLAGDSITCSTLMGIFGKLLGYTDKEIERKIRETYEIK